MLFRAFSFIGLLFTLIGMISLVFRFDFMVVTISVLLSIVSLIGIILVLITQRHLPKEWKVTETIPLIPIPACNEYFVIPLSKKDISEFIYATLDDQGEPILNMLSVERHQLSIQITASQPEMEIHKLVYSNPHSFLVINKDEDSDISYTVRILEHSLFTYT